MALLNRTREPALAGDQTAVQDAPATAQPRRRMWRRRSAAAGTGLALTIARVIRLVASVVALIIALGIAFVVFKASPGNTIVSHVHDWAKWLAGPFDGMFHLHSARGSVALNWGIALVVYLLVGSLLARIVTAPARALRRA